MDQRPLVNGHIANFGIFLDFFEFLGFGCFFPFFKKNWVFGYSWSTLMWYSQVFVSDHVLNKKNPAYGRQSISRPMRIVAPIPQQGGPRIPNTKKKFKNGKKSSKTRKLKNIQRYANISDIPFDQRSLIHWEAWFPPCFVCKYQPKKPSSFFARRFQTTSEQKCLNVRPLLFITFPQGFRISKNIGHTTSGSGGKKTVKRYLKSENTDRQTDKHTHTHQPAEYHILVSLNYSALNITF